MPGEFMSVFQDLIPDITPSQKCHINMVMKLWTEIKDDLNDTKYDYRFTSSMMGQPTPQLTHDEVPD
jgi:hypothetical protein